MLPDAGPVLAKDVLRNLDLGNSVAEMDEALERYFVETEPFRQLVARQADIVAGDKGTGKTAIYRILQQRYRTLPGLEHVELVTAFNPSGNPVFQRLAEGDVLNEGQYITIWKAYVLSLVGNWLLQIYEDAFTDSMFELDALLRRVGLRSSDGSPSTVFSLIVNLFRRLTNPKSASGGATITPSGIPILIGKIEFENPPQPVGSNQEEISHEVALDLLNRCLDEVGLEVWVALDRLDEAFQGFPVAEIPALRALFRTYLDLLPYDKIKVKLFIRRDLFRRIIAGGFVNLTHVNARRIDIVWDDEDLFDLLYRRFTENGEFITQLTLVSPRAEDVFAAVFVEKVDPGERKPRTWPWILARIRDGNNIKPPRNLIDLVKKSQEAQLRQEGRQARVYSAGMPLIGSEALKRGLQALSQDRVEDTLLAEAGQYAELIERFRGGKAEHNHESLEALFGTDAAGTDEQIKVLKEIGFLEQVGENLKVPMLYRDGLGITQGKAFGDSTGLAVDSDDE